MSRADIKIFLLFGLIVLVFVILEYISCQSILKKSLLSKDGFSAKRHDMVVVLIGLWKDKTSV